MRPDLAKCTTERPRSGGSLASCHKLKFGGRVPVHPEPEHDYPNEYGGFKSSARNRHSESKNFTDALGALRGNIRKNVGRPWDKVYSEFCRLLDRRSLSGYHIWQHLMWEVQLNTYIRDGVVYERSRWSSDRPVDGYYVHPVTGILRYKDPGSWKRKIRRKPKEVILPVPGAPGWDYKEMDGLWFRVRTIEVVVCGYKTIKTERKSANKKEISWIKERIADLKS
jgi:hypothetical protein